MRQRTSDETLHKLNKAVTSYNIFRPLDARAEIETFKNKLILSLQTKMNVHERAGACSCIVEAFEMVKMIQGPFMTKNKKVNPAKKQDTNKDRSGKKTAFSEEKSAPSGEKKSSYSAPRPAPVEGKKKAIIIEWRKLCPSGELPDAGAAELLIARPDPFQTAFTSWRPLTRNLWRKL